MLEKMDDVETFQKRNVMRFSFAPTERTVGEVLKLDGVRKAYGDHVVLRSVTLAARRGEKIGIIGKNGAGKTTLLKMIAGELPSDGGTIRLGPGVKVGYYAQHHGDTLDMTATVQEVVQRANPAAPVARVRSILGAFMFSGDDVDKPVKVLSGGERSRVALARLLVNPGNLILMDEPTNHLDLESADSLARSLTTFDGTLVFVSHSRSLIRTLATRIWNVEDGGVELYPGSLDEYLLGSQRQREVVMTAKPTVGSNAKAVGPARRRAGRAAAPAPARGDDKRASAARPTSGASATRCWGRWKRRPVEADHRAQRDRQASRSAAPAPTGVNQLGRVRVGRGLQGGPRRSYSEQCCPIKIFRARKSAALRDGRLGAAATNGDPGKAPRPAHRRDQEDQERVPLDQELHRDVHRGGAGRLRARAPQHRPGLRLLRRSPGHLLHRHGVGRGYGPRRLRQGRARGRRAHPVAAGGGGGDRHAAGPGGGPRAAPP
jgi:ATP-binding cassette subfamily F protein 3